MLSLSLRIPYVLIVDFLTYPGSDIEEKMPYADWNYWTSSGSDVGQFFFPGLHNDALWGAASATKSS